ncbi:MAG: LysE family translocator [Pseudomonadota bacterium]
MHEHLTNLFLALGIFSLGLISIGPNILAIIGTSMKWGRAQGARLAFGVGIGSGAWALITVTGVTALITAYAHTITILKIAGAAYLLWLAFKSFKSAAIADVELVSSMSSERNLFLTGFLIQMTNPKAALYWIAIVSIGLGANSPLWVAAALVVTSTLLSILGYTAYAVTFSSQPVINFYNKARRWIEGTLGVFFTFAAFKLATYKS